MCLLTVNLVSTDAYWSWPPCAVQAVKMAATEEAKETKEVQANITDTQVVRGTKYIEEKIKQQANKFHQNSGSMNRAQSTLH